MPANTKRVFYVRYLAHSIFAELLGARADIRLDRLENESPERVVTAVLAAAHAFQIGAARDELSRTYHVDKALLQRTPNLLIVSSNGAGYDTADVPACTEAGVLVLNQSGGNRQSVAEHVLAMLLALSKRIIETDRIMRRKEGMDRNAFLGTESHGKTIGIVGLGNVGSRVAELCRGVLDMRVLAYDPYLSAEEMERRGAEKVELDVLLSHADFVSINCPLTEETRGMIGARQFALMRRSALFITTSCGFIHDEDALLEALRAGKIARCRPRRLGQGAATHRSSAATARQRAGQPAYGGRHQGSARQHGPHRRRAAHRCARRQAAATHRQPAGVAALCLPLRADLRDQADRTLAQAHLGCGASQWNRAAARAFFRQAVRSLVATGHLGARDRWIPAGPIAFFRTAMTYHASANRGCSGRPRMSKNRAWLMIALTLSAWNGLVMRNVGSGRVPVSSRCG